MQAGYGLKYFLASPVVSLPAIRIIKKKYCCPEFVTQDESCHYQKVYIKKVNACSVVYILLRDYTMASNAVKYKFSFRYNGMFVLSSQLSLV